MTAGKQESLQDYFLMAKEIDRKERNLGIEHWDGISIEREGDKVGEYVMTDEQKREQISFLYRQLDTCGQIIAETEPGPERSRYNREYRGIVNALRRLEPEKWKDYPVFRQHTTMGRNNLTTGDYGFSR